MLDLESREEGDVISVTLHTACHVRHDVEHELAGLFVDVVGVDENLTDVRVEVVADGANNQA